MQNELLSLGYITKDDVKEIEKEQTHLTKLEIIANTPHTMPPVPPGGGQYSKIVGPKFGEVALKMGFINAQQYTVAAQLSAKNSNAKSTSEMSKNISEVIFRRAGVAGSRQDELLEEHPPDLLVEDKNGLYWQVDHKMIGSQFGQYVLYGWALSPITEVIKVNFDGFKAEPEEFKKAFNKTIRKIDDPFCPSIGDSYYG